MQSAVMTRAAGAPPGGITPQAAHSRTQVRMAAVAVTVIAGVTIGLIGTAGAATGTVAPIGTVTSGTPYSSGQTVKVSGPQAVDSPRART